MTAKPSLYVAYVRVSTTSQGRSGLGLEAQQEAIRAFMAAQPEARLLDPEYVEVESGRQGDRPELARALARCRATGATLLVAKLDRLARDARFLLGIVDGTSQGGVVFLDLPRLPAGPVGRFMVTQMAAVAELEAGLISQRTKAALAAAKARGVKLGGPRGTGLKTTASSIALGAQRGAETRALKADHYAHGVAGRIGAMMSQGLSLGAIARALEADGVETPRGGTGWTATGVRRAALRAGLLAS